MHARGGCTLALGRLGRSHALDAWGVWGLWGGLGVQCVLAASDRVCVAWRFEIVVSFELFLFSAPILWYLDVGLPVLAVVVTGTVAAARRG